MKTKTAEQIDENPEGIEGAQIDGKAAATGLGKLQKKPEDEDSGESDSSSAGKHSGSGSGCGGYSADCSDQSSDDAGKRGSKSLKKEVAKLTLTDKTPGNDEQHVKAKPKHDRLDIEAFVTDHRKKVEELTKKSGEAQVNGVKVLHPMDPRIDISDVAHDTKRSVPASLPPGPPLPLNGDHCANYEHIMEAVTPFFVAQGVDPQQPLPKLDAEAEEPVSSEGFTSFFTTTTSGAGESSVEKKQSQDENAQDDAATSSDTSSLVVLARVKSKHKKCNPESSNSSSEKRVRIAPPDNVAVAQNEGFGDTSSSSELRVPEPQQQEEDVPKRIVTDTSRTTDGTTTSNPTSSGSGGNTGSGSNPGSSGSNEEKGNSDKRSSEDICKDASKELEHKDLETETGTPNSVSAAKKDQQRKLQQKKRKRIEMRREYEAQQHIESSSGSDGDIFFKPGRPVGLDQVLQFSGIARVVVQSTPPFLIVHANAAFSRLTGLEAHLVTGKKLAWMLRTSSRRKSLTMKSPPDKRGQTTIPGTTVLSSTASETSLERLITSCGSGHVQPANVITGNELLGLKVKVALLRSEVELPPEGEKDEKSNSTSDSGSHDSAKVVMACRAAIVPIISAPRSLDQSATVPETDKRTKRRKQDPEEVKSSSSDSRRPHHGKPVVTHFLIQLEGAPGNSGPKQEEVGGSITSHPSSVEARLQSVKSTTREIHQTSHRDVPSSNETQIASDTASEEPEGTIATVG